MAAQLQLPLHVRLLAPPSTGCVACWVQALEARDNARFLATLERHLRVLEGGNMQAVADALAPLLNALRMVRRASVVGRRFV